MARYRDAVCRLCRREGTKLFLKGDRCFSEKCAIDRKQYGPGQHTQIRRKVSEYGLQLREKQKARRFYGVLEKQFKNYFRKAERQKGITGDNLLRLLERRLENIVFRMGFAASRKEARQLVTHGHFMVNGKKVNIPSYLVRSGDEIAVKDRSKNSSKFKEIAESAAHKTVPSWLQVDAQNLSGRVLELPSRDDIDVPVEEHLIVELYSK